MWWIFVVSLATFANAIDHDVFKNCSRIPFCTELRTMKVAAEDQFGLDVRRIVLLPNNTVFVPLTNSRGDTVELTVYLGLDKPRVKIQEPDSSRFNLRVGYSLVSEPDRLSILHEYHDCEPNSDCRTRLTLQPKVPPGESIYFVELVNGTPFRVQFLDAEKNLISFLDGERFVMQHEEDKSAYAFEFQFNSERIYGLFDHAWNLSLGSTLNTDPLRMRNSDSWGYEANSPMALYGSHPIIYGHSANYTSGIFLHNAAEQWIDVYEKNGLPTAYFMVEGAAFDLFILNGPTPRDVVQQITNLTGRANLPQLWTLGYHQCRFSYKSQDDVKEVANLMVKYRFPMDAIWLDGDHTDEYRWFHWNRTTFPDPIELQKNISSLNKVCVSISDPHIKVEDTYNVYAGAVNKFFVKWYNQTNVNTAEDYQADCWPGLSSWIDFLYPAAADYYSTWYQYDKFNGSTPTLAGIWNDMNEPAVFDDSTEKTLPWDTVHRLDINGVEFVQHKDVHNIYGLMHTRATYKGLLVRDDYKKRPFILTRSTFAGSQTVAAMWTGDNSATWEHFANSLSQCMTANMLGMVFCGADIGGFIGDPSDELLQRWYQGAVWTPFFRGHSSRESKRREPYLFSEEVQDVIRSTIELRYKHIWQIYTLFHIHSTTGVPILTPLFYHYPGIQERDSQMLIGREIMAVAVTEAGLNSVNILFPGTSDDYWFRIDDNSWKAYQGNNLMDISVTIKSSPVFYKSGSIVTRKDTVRLSTFDATDDPYTLYINADISGNATGHFYYDDFTSFEYINNKMFVFFELIWTGTDSTVSFKLLDGELVNYNATFTDIVVHSTNKLSNGELVTVEKIYNTTRDGQVLRDIKLGQHVLKYGQSYEIHL